MNAAFPDCNKLAIRLLLGTMLSAACLSASAASFDCAKARSTSERLICEDPQLSALDDRLAALAAAGKKRASNPRAYQRALDAAWSVRQKCADIVCVESWYARRIDELSNAEADPGRVVKAPVPAPAPEPRPDAVSAAPTPAPPKAEVLSPAKPVARTAPPPLPAPAPTADKPVPAPAPRITPPPRRVAVTPVIEKPAKPNVSPGAQLQVIGAELGFSIPLTREEFLERYEASGGQCGVGQHLSSLKAKSRSVVSACRSGTECRAPSSGLSCKLLQTGYDTSGRLVLFTTTLGTGGANGTDGARDLSKLVERFSEFGGGATRTRDVGKGRAVSSSGSQGQFQLEAEVVTAEGEKQVGTFSLATK